ncbi:hypothetical protein [Vibrio mexicanus]|uniref:hypothetical protein n=1 Tax=Vibrio mexicanus TaxID=1004326 RepID=UPI00063C5E6C|nr:hypothetical protein [Vibrio mexicanus]
MIDLEKKSVVLSERDATLIERWALEPNNEVAVKPALQLCSIILLTILFSVEMVPEWVPYLIVVSVAVLLAFLVSWYRKYDTQPSSFTLLTIKTDVEGVATINGDSFIKIREPLDSSQYGHYRLPSTARQKFSIGDEVEIQVCTVNKVVMDYSSHFDAVPSVPKSYRRIRYIKTMSLSLFVCALIVLSYVGFHNVYLYTQMAVNPGVIKVNNAKELYEAVKYGQRIALEDVRGICMTGEKQNPDSNLYDYCRDFIVSEGWEGVNYYATVAPSLEQLIAVDTELVFYNASTMQYLRLESNAKVQGVKIAHKSKILAFTSKRLTLWANWVEDHNHFPTYKEAKAEIIELRQNSIFATKCGSEEECWEEIRSGNSSDSSVTYALKEHVSELSVMKSHAEDVYVGELIAINQQAERELAVRSGIVVSFENNEDFLNIWDDLHKATKGEFYGKKFTKFIDKTLYPQLSAGVNFSPYWGS